MQEAEYSKEVLNIRPGFDLEMLMGLLQESRLGGQVMEDLVQSWDRWLDQLHVITIQAGKIKYLAVWLEEGVEEEIDQRWGQSPSEAFRYNCLAQSLCMSAVYHALPEVENAGCAPAPKPTPAISAALEAEGLPYLEANNPALVRRFSVLTHYPFKGACDICYLSEDCPKAKANAESFHSIEIPGPELPPSLSRMQL